MLLLEITWFLQNWHNQAVLSFHLHVYCHFSHAWIFANLWTIARQAPLSMGFSRQEYWSGLPFPPPGDLPDPGIEPVSLISPALAGRFFITSATWEAQFPSVLFKINGWSLSDPQLLLDEPFNDVLKPIQFWSLNNKDLNCVGPLILAFFFFAVNM